jgi:RNA polymerase sigma-70 factor (sigma-E family)
VTVEQSMEQEFTAFVADRTHALMRIAYALTGEQRAAEDLVQNALAKAFASWPRIRGDAEPYVRRILYNDQVSWWRRRTRQPEVSMAVLPDTFVESRHENDTALRLMMRDALRLLPPRQRAVLVLRYLEDRTVDETAAVLGCRPGTVASQASRALDKLRDLVPALHDLTEARR